MRTIITLLILLFSATFNLKAQEDKNEVEKSAPKSIYFSTIENESTMFYAAFRKQMDSFKFKFLKFDEDRLAANLSNPLYFSAFKIKPTKYYLDTYKKMYDLRGQHAAFFNVEKLYEIPPQYNKSKRNK